MQFSLEEKKIILKQLSDENILTKIINLIYFVDYVSIYKDLISGIDPSPVHSINFIKSHP